MATWNGVITNAGNSVLNEWVNEKTLSFDSAATGQGIVPAQAMLAQTALVSQKQTASLLGGESVDVGIRLKIRITAPDTAYTLNQYGVWASVNGGQSSLVALFQLEEGIPIPSKTESPDFVYTFYALIMCSNTGAWTVTVDTSVGVTAEDMQEAINTAIATREGLLKDASLKGSLVDSDSLAIIDSADNSNTKRVLWSTIKSTLSSLFVPLTRKINSKSLSSDVTLTGADIQVSGTDNTKIDAALSNKADSSMGYLPGESDIFAWAEQQQISGCFLVGSQVTNTPEPGFYVGELSIGAKGYEFRSIKLTQNTTGKTWVSVYMTITGEWVWTDWIPYAIATPPKEYDLSLTGATGTCKYSLDQFGVVRITGLITRDGGTAYFGTLPEGYRPVNQVTFACCGFTDGNTVSPCTVGVDPDGRVWVNDFGGGFTKVPVNMYFLAGSSLL